jgi:hypothetical protein
VGAVSGAIAGVGAVSRAVVDTSSGVSTGDWVCEGDGGGGDGISIKGGSADASFALSRRSSEEAEDRNQS